MTGYLGTLDFVYDSGRVASMGEKVHQKHPWKGKWKQKAIWATKQTLLLSIILDS